MADANRNRSGPSIERRKSERAPVVVRVDYTTVDEFFSEFTQNINEGGLFIETESPLEPESKVQLQFDLPGTDEPVKATGRVVRVEPTGMALEFDDLDPGTRDRINQLVKSLRSG